MGAAKFTFIHGERTVTDKSGNALIQLKIYKDRIYRYIQTSIAVKASEWDDVQKCVIRHNQAIKYNVQLQSLKSLAISYLANNPEATADEIKVHLKGESASATQNFFSFCRQIISESTLEPSTLSQDNRMLYFMNEFDPNVEFYKIDYAYIQRFERFLLNTKGGRGTLLKGSYVTSMLAKLKKYCNEARRYEIIVKDPFAAFKLKKHLSEKVALTELELKKWEETDVSKLKGRGRLQDCWRIFLFGCYTGLRFSDLMSLSWGEIHEVENSTFITKMPKKTRRKKIVVKLPLSMLFQGKAELLLDESEPTPLPQIANTCYNKALKVICKQIEIEKHITAHSSRHTFGTILTDLGVPIEIIRELMGHASVTTTEVYAKVRGKTVTNALRNKFR